MFMVSFQVGFSQGLQLIHQESKILAVVATAGQGEMPKSAVKFWQDRVVSGFRGRKIYRKNAGFEGACNSQRMFFGS